MEKESFGMNDADSRDQYGFSLLEKDLEESIWEKILKTYRFSPKYASEPYPWIDLPAPGKVFSMLESSWDEEQERLVNSFFLTLNIPEVYALDWQHDCFLYSPKNYGNLVREYHDEKRNCNVYFPSFDPNGDYHFFLDPKGQAGIFGHPWLREIAVFGQELIELFERNADSLGLK